MNKLTSAIIGVIAFALPACGGTGAGVGDTLNTLAPWGACYLGAKPLEREERAGSVAKCAVDAGLIDASAIVGKANSETLACVWKSYEGLPDDPSDLQYYAAGVVVLNCLTAK